MLEQAISRIDIISRPYENYGFHSMCGLKFTFYHNKSLYIGTHLTEMKIPDIWILMSEEVDTNLHYEELTLASE